MDEKEKLRRQRISEALKGKRPKNLDYLHSLPHTAERRKKVSAKLKGRKHTEEAKKKCGLANKGKVMSDEQKEKLSQNSARYWLGKKRPEMCGEKNWNFRKYGSEHSRYVRNKKSTLRKSIRNSKVYRDYKLLVLKRDKYKCVLCGNNKPYLELDHYPKSFATLLKDITTIEQALSCDRLWDVNNSRILCSNCHEKTANFPKQLIGKRKQFLYRMGS